MPTPPGQFGNAIGNSVYNKVYLDRIDKVKRVISAFEFDEYELYRLGGKKRRRTNVLEARGVGEDEDFGEEVEWNDAMNEWEEIKV
jgi:recombination DNA repair RAD52 pathway protein